MAGTPTPYYGFPIPSDNDPADAPHDFQALAQKIEDTLKNGYTIPTGNLIIGEVGQTAQRLVYFRRRVAPDEYATTLSCGGNQQYIAIYKNDLLQGTHTLRGDGSYLVDVGGVSRPHPFAMEINSQAMVYNNVATLAVPITYQTNRFTQVPLVLATVYNHSFMSVYTTSVSATGVTLNTKTTTGANYTGTFYVHWMAIQMTPTSSAG